MRRRWRWVDMRLAWRDRNDHGLSDREVIEDGAANDTLETLRQWGRERDRIGREKNELPIAIQKQQLHDRKRRCRVAGAKSGLRRCQIQWSATNDLRACSDDLE